MAGIASMLSSCSGKCQETASVVLVSTGIGIMNARQTTNQIIRAIQDGDVEKADRLFVSAIHLAKSGGLDESPAPSVWLLLALAPILGILVYWGGFYLTR
ncbi:hypothetical protein NBH19_07965 [Rhizobium sp. S95]|uniref:Uncharacterized protein n=1 Tax=Ciceribacter sichuanensis TaxID=2949647 RepID=A0AAJ1F7N0_9HYPH|nr:MULTISPECIES: hypothetical protein [unclassified Ciceribacter]MCM2396020.1 hypothetical protein [Ciceribacter sp. S95]MCO5960140.1 hypothetical protein [Ciceribacter sp. S101]